MPTSDTRHRIEIPLDLYQAINQAAADAAMPTSALATMWLLHMLRAAPTRPARARPLPLRHRAVRAAAPPSRRAAR